MTSLPVLQVVGGLLSELPADLVVVPTWDDDGFEDLAEVRDLCGAELAAARARGEWRGKPFDVFTAPVPWRASRVLFVAAGPSTGVTGELVRRVAAAAALAARQRGARRVVFCIRGPFAGTASLQAVVEGSLLATFDYDFLKTSPRELATLETVLIAGASGDGVDDAVARGSILGEATNAARRLVAEPSNTLTPTEFASRAASLLEGTGVSIEVLDEGRISALGMGLFGGVAKGSAEPPRLLVMRYEPAGDAASPVLGLVGKGITFDTGGISIKPAEGMDRMKYDMAGGAAVVGAMRAIGLLAPRVRVVGVVPACENMPGGRSFKPGDVLRGASGKTVEITNTDAEGRLLLADALWYARELGATHLVDLATLTGACAVALGKLFAGIFGVDDAWTASVRASADAAGDRVWPLPLHDEFLEQMRSDIADIINAGSRWGGASTAAMFVKEFTGDLPWVHLDIAGVAWAEEAKPYQPKGPTGFGVRTLAQLALTIGATRA